MRFCLWCLSGIYPPNPMQLVSEEVKYVTNMVRKDVLRTDRHHPYFSGTDDNTNIQSLSNILTT